MILCEHAHATTEAFDELSVFVSQLNAAGVTANVNVDALPENLHRNLQYELEPYLCDASALDIEKVIVLEATTLPDEKLAYLRNLNFVTDAQIYAVGRFQTPQTKISVLSKLSYALGRDPVLVDQDMFSDVAEGSKPAFGVFMPRSESEVPRVLLLAPELENPRHLEDIYSVVHSRQFETTIVTNGASKEIWQKKFGFGDSVYQFGELPPSDISATTDICVLLSDVSKNQRANSILRNTIVSGAVLVDCSQSDFGHQFESIAIQGPINLGYLPGFLSLEVAPNVPGLSEISKSSRLAFDIDISRFLEQIQCVNLVKAPSTKGGNRSNGVMFVPTNGVGLGHAQRCSLVAGALPEHTTARFAAFPSCLPMINRYGFDGIPLVSRSDLHQEPHANDILNFARLDTTIQPNEVFVFDGGYVFDSIYRTIAKHRLKSVWIRRGLWQAQQNNSVALDREKVFSSVIVPSEAFEELNHRYSDSKKLKTVGPIVQTPDSRKFNAGKLRENLRQRFDRDFDHLVVTMLGGGVAADRTAQIQAICAAIERRDDTLNLVVTWPTARVDPGWFCWQNSRVVRTHHANPLVSASDLFISAVGYNSFHEAMYNRVPSIFIPQMSAFMDDQRARAESALSRGAAILVEPNQMSTLDREISNCLDGGKNADLRKVLTGLDLPPPGNSDAAHHIEGFLHD